MLPAGMVCQDTLFFMIRFLDSRGNIARVENSRWKFLTFSKSIMPSRDCLSLFY